MNPVPSRNRGRAVARPRSVPLSGALALWVWLAVPAGAGPQSLSLDNGILRLTVRIADGTAYLAELIPKAQGRNLVSSVDPDHSVPLFEIDLYEGNRRTATLNPGFASSLALSRPDSRTVELRAEYPREGLTVRQRTTLAPGDRVASFRASFRYTGRGRIGVVRLAPLALTLSGDASATVLLPVADGALLRDPYAHYRDGEKRTFNYPGMASCQLLAAFDRAGGALAYAADGAGDFKLLAVQRNGKRIGLGFESILYHLDPPEIEMPYAIRVGAFEGGWERAADAYKEWARGQAWCAVPLAARAIPKPFDRVPVTLGANLREGKGTGAVNRSGEIPAYAGDWQRALGLPVNMLLFSWEKHGPWIAPDYFPPYGGEQAFRGLIGDLHARGCTAGAFLSGFNVTLEKSGRNGAPAYRAELPDRKALAAAAIIGMDGRIVTEGDAGEGTGKRAVLCPSTPLARSMVTGQFRKLRSYGLDWIQVDQVVGGGTPPCFSTRHGHPPAGGNSMFRATASLLDSLARLEPSVALSLEEPGELFIPHVHLFHTREYVENMWPRDGAGVAGAPLFNYLYHEYALGYGGDSAPFARPGEDPAVAIYAQAVNLVDGRLPGAAEWMRMAAPAQVHPDQIRFMRDAAGLWKGRAGEYLRRGTAFALDGQQAQPMRINAKAAGAAFDIATSRILARGYRLADGRAAVCYVNIAGTPARSPLRFAAGKARAEVLWPPAPAGAAAREIAAGAEYAFPPYGILFAELRP